MIAPTLPGLTPPAGTDTARASDATEDRGVPVGLHVAIIMDGNGRWAVSRGLPRAAGHRAGARAVRRTVETAPRFGIRTLTLFAFSSDNWSRPPSEVQTLMRLFRDYLEREREHAADEGLRITVIGRRDRLDPALGRAIAEIESATSAGTRLHLRLAVDYSSREAILAAARRARADRALSVRRFSRLVNRATHGPADSPPVDLLIRTSGEKRLSDFLLWESAYAELWFTDRLWPDFAEADLSAAVAEFRTRSRRFGGLSPISADPA